MISTRVTSRDDSPRPSTTKSVSVALHCRQNSTRTWPDISSIASEVMPPWQMPLCPHTNLPSGQMPYIVLVSLFTSTWWAASGAARVQSEHAFDAGISQGTALGVAAASPHPRPENRGPDVAVDVLRGVEELHDCVLPVHLVLVLRGVQCTMWASSSSAADQVERGRRAPQERTEAKNDTLRRDGVCLAPPSTALSSHPRCPAATSGQQTTAAVRLGLRRRVTVSNATPPK